MKKSKGKRHSSLAARQKSLLPVAIELAKQGMEVVLAVTNLGRLEGSEVGNDAGGISSRSRLWCHESQSRSRRLLHRQQEVTAKVVALKFR